MAQLIEMPKLSDTMTVGTVVKWHKNKGDPVSNGDILAEIETDKATMELENFEDGILLEIFVEAGLEAAIGSPLAVVGEAGEDVSSLIPKEDQDPEPVASEESSDEKETPTGKIGVEPSSEEEIANEEVDHQLQVASADPIISNSGSSRVVASPLAKKIALEKNIDLNLIKGSGENGRIVKSDIDNFVPKVKETKDLKVISQPTSLKSSESFNEIENSQMRKVIARRLTESKFSAPHYYLSVEFDMNNTIAFREQYNTLPDTKISYNDIVVKACAISLKKHPKVNSQWFPEKIRINHHVHIGVAVGVSDGLLVPVIKHANDKSLTQIGSEIKDMAVRSRDKKIKPEEMEGSTFTISNLGMYGIHEFTSIINQPNSAILSVGSIIKKPVVKDEKILVGNTMKLTLACDHRTVDGVTGSEFLETLRGYIENPVTMLV